jgi:serine phosphatase RsbU (regulator of sigma subunit)/pSer/pThr/pTyr-binding forkhead associated (FHA) protein
MRELQILSPDGKSRVIELTGARITLGRSSAAELCFPDDTGLSRQHLAFERDGDGETWAINDLNSKNGTILNGAKVVERTILKSGDRVMAGHLILVYDGATVHGPKPVVIFDPGDGEEHTSSSTVITNLEGVIQPDHTEGDSGIAAAQVSALIRAGNELAGHRPLPELFRFILDLAIQAVKADRGILLTLEDGELVVRANRGDGFRISSAVRDRVLNSGNSVLVRDTSIDDAFKARRSIVEQNIRTLMAVPLQTREQIIGIIYVDSPSLLREFTKDDLSVLTVMANVAAIRIEQTRFAEIEQARQLLARDLEQAAEIQKSFLPGVAPVVRGLDLGGHNAACRTVGGDYYDFFTYGQSRVAMVLGDVSGKGMPASLLMMGLQARVQVLIEEPKNLAEVMTKLNRITSANCPANRFISLFFCILDGDTGELTFCNAGHNPPLIIRADGSWAPIKGGGPVIGILPSIEYQEYKLKLDEGDTLVIYSDGVTEAADLQSEEFEVERLAEAVAKSRHLPARTIVDVVNRAVAEFTGAAPQSDDITLIVARRVPA